MFPKPQFRLRSVLPGILALLATASLAQTTINVGPGETYTTIQSGINAAVNGDTVLVASGTYDENINFNGKAITVISAGGAASTIIDGGNKPGIATVVLASGETSASVISGFTIQGGGDTIFDGASDGGIYIGNSSATIQGNTITANYCHNIDVEFGFATILDNEVSGVLENGPGSYCTFGSGIHLQGTPYSANLLGSNVLGNTIENNLAGSGINLWAAQNVLIMNNTIRNNTSPDFGSGFTSANSEGTVIAQNLIYDNTSSCGGALQFEDSGPGVSAVSVFG
jgi:nitrous oxidase accessory protein NosD